MRSPFPGMDPYLEPFWGDVHSKLIVYVAEALNEQLPAGLRVVAEEDVSVASDDPDDPVFVRPDITIAPSPARSSVPPVSGGTLVEVPSRSIRVRLNRDPRTERRVLIVDPASGGRIITAIEVLSPANKSSAARKYLRKLSAYRAAGVNVVEVDLLRFPSRDRLELDSFDLPADLRTTYLAVVYRGSEPDEAELIPAPLREPLPTVPIPLRSSDPEARLSLQPLVDRVYKVGRYADIIDYTKPCQPPLSPDDAAWAASLLPART